MSASSSATAAFDAAVRRLDVDAMRAALEACARKRGWPAVTDVIRAGEPEEACWQAAALRRLGEYGCLDAKTATEALPWAIEHNSWAAVVQVLLDAGGDARRVSPLATGVRSGGTLLHRVERADFARALIAAGADVNAADRNGRRPIHIIAAACDFTRLDPPVDDILGELVAAGADVNAVDVHGRTCLFAATPDGGQQPAACLAKVLLGLGVDPTIPDQWGDAPVGATMRCLHEWARGVARRTSYPFE